MNIPGTLWEHYSIPAFDAEQYPSYELGDTIKSNKYEVVSNSILVSKLKVVPEFLRTLVFPRPRGDDQFADCTFSPSLDMSR